MSDVQFRFRDDAAVTEPAVSIEAFDEQTNASVVRIEPGEDARKLLPFLDRLQVVEVSFPAWTEGRGYSSARVLREAGYEGELRAVGDVVIDMLSHLRRCGFDSFAPNQVLNESDAQAAFDRWSNVYQKTTDGRTPIWAKRHPHEQNG